MPTSLTYPLDRIAAVAPGIHGVWTKDLRAGDWVVVRTKNSCYSLAALGDGRFSVTGGWFDRNNVEAATVRVTGCTFGGRAIVTGLVAAPGMFVEFENGVCTTRIRDVQLIRHGETTRVH